MNRSNQILKFAQNVSKQEEDPHSRWGAGRRWARWGTWSSWYGARWKVNFDTNIPSRVRTFPFAGAWMSKPSRGQFEPPIGSIGLKTGEISSALPERKEYSTDHEMVLNQLESSKIMQNYYHTSCSFSSTHPFGPGPACSLRASHCEYM